MAATAGSIVMMSNATKRTFTVDLYIPDATGTALTFNPAGLAGTGSPTSYRVPEDVTIIDVSIGTAPTAVGAVLQVNGAPVSGGTLRWANQLQTLANRAKLALGIKGGDFISYTQF